MVTAIKLACDSTIMTVALDQILPMRVISKESKGSAKYRCIAASISELGIIEPLVVFPQAGEVSYMLLDGHIRLEVLKDLGEAAAPCLVSHDDEAFTYNHKVNHLSPIQEHFMIQKAIKSGAPEDRLAAALNVDMEAIRKKMNLLDGICSEAVAYLRDKTASASAIRELRRAKPMRQMEIAELMCAAHNYSVAYVKCMIAASPVEQLCDVDHAKDSNGLSADDAARMEREMETLGKEFKLVEESHGQNTLNLVVIVAYLRKLLENNRVVKYLSLNYPELLAEFQKLVENRGLRE
jgi:ParB-like chromosome segregation protein Spo0J